MRLGPGAAHMCWLARCCRMSDGMRTQMRLGRWAMIAGCVIGQIAEAADAPKRPARFNVILISLDTVRPDHVSCYGYHRKTTPNIDRVVKDDDDS